MVILITSNIREQFCLYKAKLYFAIKQLVMPTLRNRPPVLWLLLLFLSCFMSALESLSLCSMTLVMLGHVANNGDFQWGEVIREKTSIIMQHRVKTQDSEAGLAKTTGCKGAPEED